MEVRRKLCRRGRGITATSKKKRFRFLFMVSTLLMFSSFCNVGNSFSFKARKRNIPSISRNYETYCQNTVTKTGHQKIRCWELSRLSTRLYDGYETETETAVMEGTVNNGKNGDTQHEILNGHNGSSSNGQLSPTLINSISSDVPLPTENGGYTHTNASKAKISAANKGKTPWNKGRSRSDAVKAKIAAGVRARNRERFLQKLKDMGLTEEEYEAKKKEERRKKDADKRARRTAKGGYRPTDETKAKISKILKEKFKNGEIKPRKVDPSKVRRGFTHSEETRAKISESLKKRWANDPDYRERMKTQVKKANTKEETRARISATLKKKWQDPEFRGKMMEKISSRQTNFKHDDAHREKISKAMKEKWKDQEYREKALKSIASRKNPDSPGATRRKSAVKGSSASVRMVEPMTQGEKKTKTTKRKRKKAIRIVDKDEDKDEDLDAVAKQVKPTTKRKKASPTKKAAKKKKEPDGSVNRLREERRDLFDLLYGDDDSDNSAEAQSKAAMFALGDEDLDSFDPYGLDDY